METLKCYKILKYSEFKARKVIVMNIADERVRRDNKENTYVTYP
jgi:hypothetical protein